MDLFSKESLKSIPGSGTDMTLFLCRYLKGTKSLRLIDSEKFVPVIIYKILKNEKIPVYGKGLNVREWLYVSDCAGAIMTVMKKGKFGEIYNVGSGIEKKNIDVVKSILDFLNKSDSLIEFVKDRPGHHYRYSLNFSKIRDELNWNPKIDFEKGIDSTIRWYTKN